MISTVNAVEIMANRPCISGVLTGSVTLHMGMRTDIWSIGRHCVSKQLYSQQFCPDLYPFMSLSARSTHAAKLPAGAD